MGGVAGGQKASKIVIETARDVLEEKFCVMILFQKGMDRL